MRFERILFYSDLSQAADNAFPFALGLARSASTCHLYVVHVLPSPYRFYAEVVEPGLALGLNPEMASFAEKTLQDRYAKGLEGGPQSSFHVLVGVEGVELVRFARKHRVEAMVMAASVAEARMGGAQSPLRAFLAKRCPCPLLMVQPARQSLRRGFRAGPAKILEMRNFKRRPRGPVAEGPD
jgi:nucleotide-binding universal stress UspA family protein